MRHIRNQAAALVALVTLVSCTNDDSQAQTGSAPTGGESTTGATPVPDYTVIGPAHHYGPGRWAITAFGDPAAPMAVLDVPAGFQATESWVWTDLQGARRFGQLAYWKPTRVLVDPCDADTPSPPLGPTVADLAAALASQRRTTTTEPVPVELDGHRGLYLELTSPARLDYQKCAPGGGMQIWEAGADSARVLDFSATDRYWIVEVGGRRVVVSAVTGRRAAPETVELVTGLVEGTRFVAAE